MYELLRINGIFLCFAGRCYNCSPKCVCIAVSIFLIISLLASASFGFAGPLFRALAVDFKHDIQAVSSWTPEYYVFETTPLSTYNHFVEVDLSRQIVHNMKSNNSEISLYCDDYLTSILANNQRVQSSTFSIKNKTIKKGNRFLPFTWSQPNAWYALAQSNLSVLVCLFNHPSPLPSLQLQLHKKNATSWEADKNPIIASINMSFDNRLCSNNTIVVPESSVVFLSLLTSGTVGIKLIDCNVTLLLYTETTLGISNASNLIGTEKLIPGSVHSKLLCYVTGGLQPFIVDPQVVRVSAPIKWKLDFFLGFLFTSVIIALAIVSILIIFILCGLLRLCKIKFRTKCCNPYQNLE